MIEFEPELFIDESICKLFNKRQYKKSFKKALQYAMKKWHEIILKTHFTRTAYSKYPAIYINKKKSGRPMVKTGQLQRSVLNNIRLRGTSTKVTGKVFFGKPNRLNKEEFRKRTFARMRLKRIDYARASKQVSMAEGNYAEHRMLFQAQIKTMNQSDVERIHKWVNDFMMEEYRSVGRLRKVKKTTANGCK